MRHLPASILSAHEISRFSLLLDMGLRILDAVLSSARQPADPAFSSFLSWTDVENEEQFW